MWKNLLAKLRQGYWQILGCLLLLANHVVQADSANPFPAVDIGGGDVVAGAGSKMQMGLKYATLGIGGLLILVGIGVLIHRMREDTREKEHGNLIMSFVIVALCETVGFTLIAIGWKAFNTQIS